ncbi:MAG: cobaltochelatase subunit CobN, partial [Gammaproteobacteria bacterium]|nr:cobaltochelatase subunit CobN [Gammaproteobacteria bacterium]
MKSYLAIFLSLLTLGEVSAATLFGVVSERSAAELASASYAFDRSHPGHTLILRTPEQLGSLSDKQLNAILKQSDVVLLAAVFGDSVPRLQTLLARHSHHHLIAIHSDRRLVRLSRWQGKTLFEGFSTAEFTQLNINPDSDQAFADYLQKLKSRFPAQRAWIDARAYWQARGTDNMTRLLGWLLAAKDSRIKTEPPLHHGNRRWFQAGHVVDYSALTIKPKKKTVAILDHQTGDRQGDIDLLNQLCGKIKTKDLNCFAILSAWGETSSDSVKRLYELKDQLNIGAVISLHDFVIGGGNFRQQSDAWLARLDVPVFRGIRLTDRQSSEWQGSEDGLPWNSVHYRVAMPELQGISQPMVLATTTPQSIDPLTGLSLSITAPEPAQVEHMAARVGKWLNLQSKDNFNKRLAIIYYNHPPGRHNIGADNLDVPASLFQLLQRLKQAGYDTGELPTSQEALLDQIQQRGINLPEDAAAIRAMAPHIQRIPASDYKKWLEQLPMLLQAEMEQGPLAKLDQLFFTALDEARTTQARALLDNKLTEVRHLIEGASHPARERALNLLDQLSELYQQGLKGVNAKALQQQTPAFITALRDTGIEGLRGWGAAPGKVMV